MTTPNSSPKPKTSPKSSSSSTTKKSKCSPTTFKSSNTWKRKLPPPRTQRLIVKVLCNRILFYSPKPNTMILLMQPWFISILTSQFMTISAIILLISQRFWVKHFVIDKTKKKADPGPNTTIKADLNPSTILAQYLPLILIWTSTCKATPDSTPPSWATNTLIASCPQKDSTNHPQ